MEIKILGVYSTLGEGELINAERMIKEIMSASEKYTERVGDLVKSDVVLLTEDKIKSGCTYCNWCLEGQTADVFCAIDDVFSKEIYSKIIEADALLVATSVYMGINWLMTSFINRLYALNEGCYYGSKGPFGDDTNGILKNKVLAVVSGDMVRHDGIETAVSHELFSALMFGMIPVTASINDKRWVGGVPVLKTKEFAIFAESIGRRIVEVTRLIKAGKTALKKFPAYI